MLCTWCELPYWSLTFHKMLFICMNTLFVSCIFNGSYFWTQSFPSTGENLAKNYVMWHVEESCPICLISSYTYCPCTRAHPFYLLYSFKRQGNRPEWNSLIQGLQNHWKCHQSFQIKTIQVNQDVSFTHSCFKLDNIEMMGISKGPA